MKRLAQLFWEFFKISLFVIGGGYAIVVVADGVCARRGWTDDGELIDQLPVFQMTPGLIATHTAVYVGRKLAGAMGAMVAVVAVAIPSVVIFAFVSAGYDSLPLQNPWLKSAFIGLRAALTGIIGATIVRSWTRLLPDAFAYSVMAAALALIGFAGVPVAWTLLGAAAIGLMAAFATRRGASAGKKRFNASWLPLLLFLKYGSLCFGGGFVLVPMYLEDFIGPAAPYLQLTSEEFSNLMALTQMTPGPIGVNGATFFGYRLAGLPGSLIASVALLLPGSLAMYFILRSLERFRTSQIVVGLLRGIRPATVALMLVALFEFAAMSAFALGEDGVDFNFTAITITVIIGAAIMKKKLNPVVAILVAALAATALRAEEEPITLERFPNADAVLVEEIERVKYNLDGTYVQTSEAKTKVLTEKGRREESVIQLDFNKRYSVARMLYVGIIDAEGNEREVDVSSTTRETTDNSSMRANIYDPLDRKLVVTVPELKVGETLHVKSQRVQTVSRFEDKWSDIVVMEWTNPIIRSVYEVTSPAKLPLKCVKVCNPLGNITESQRTLEDGSVVHTFVATNSPQAFPEPNMPGLYTQVQHLRLTTAASWKEMSNWYWRLCEPHLLKTNEAMTNKVNELKGDLRSIFKFVSQEIRYMGLTLEETSPGWAPHDACITFDNRYGVCRDKAGLLVSMLRIAGYNAFPVLIEAGSDKLDPEIGQPFFNHAIVAVDRGDRDYLLMDPTDENAKELLQPWLGDCSYLVSRPEGEDLLVSPVADPGRNALDVVSKGKLAKDGSIFLENEITMNGANDSIYRGALVRRTPDDRVKLFERIVKSMAPGAELIRCEILPENMLDTDSPIVIRLATRLPEMVLSGDSLDELTVPFISRSVGLANMMLSGNTSLVQRRFTLRMGATAKVSERLTLDIGSALGPVKSLPAPERITGGYAFSREFAVSNGVLTASRELAIAKKEFSPADYADLREQMKTVEAAERQRPVFAADDRQDADVDWLLSSTEVDIASDRVWSVTNTFVKEILTYQGKKGSAELNFSYNPTWQNVEVVSAVVSNRDGRVAKVTPKEMNVMDCGWAASAPRYPASKMLIVNLPSVEIGSVIAVTTVMTATNAPAPYYDAFTFDSQEPLRRRLVRVNDWRREVISPRRLPKEAWQPYAELWRDRVVVSSNEFHTIDLKLGEVSFPEAGEDLRSIRDWMAKYVRVAGPGLYELPLEQQLTDPETVLRERYATRLDYVRTLCALLRAAGYDADVVLAASNADETPAMREADKFLKPNLRAFSAALCRVKVREGGWLGFGGEEKTYFIGLENEYAELGATAYFDCDYFDPATGEFGVVTVPDPALVDHGEETREFFVNADGSVDIDFEKRYFGTEVAGFRKRFAEILPEDRSRHYQSLLGSVSQAATATRELVTDISAYPAVRAFSCHVPNFATVTDGAITLQLSGLASSLPAYAGSVRATPFAVGKADDDLMTVKVRFPKGYTEVEHLPASFALADPADPAGRWLEGAVTSEVRDGVLTVTITRRVHRRGYSCFGSQYFELLRDWNRLATSGAARTIIVRAR